MKKTKTPSLTAAQFYMKRLYKYIRFYIKVFQNICIPHPQPAPLENMFCHSPSHRAHSFCCGTGVQFSALIIMCHLHGMTGGGLKN
jgi:hypothetical protein